jgi:hypothetical protein
VGQHPELPQALYDRIYTERRADYLDLLLDGPLAKTEEVQYLRSHRAYFELDQAFHGGPGYVYLAKTVAIYCVPTEKRVKELESFGPSATAWEARRNTLNDMRGDLAMPWTEAYGLPFSRLQQMFDAAKKLYSRPEDRVLLSEWVSETEALFFKMAEKEAKDGYAGLTRTQQLEMLHTWIAGLREGL